MAISTPSTYLAGRLDKLRKTQNPDGGWSFYAGKTASWVEPTVYAALALHGQPEADRAWALIRGWQLTSGGWKPAADVPGANWTTALGVILGASRGGQNAAVSKGLEWLHNNGKDGAWSWRRGNLSAVEPTALAVLALRKAGVEVPKAGRAENFLLADKLSPETCGPALAGLHGSSQVRGLVPLAEQWAAETTSPLTRAWITIGLRVNGVEVGDPKEGAALPRNLAIVALEALAASDGNYRLFQMEVAA